MKIKNISARPILNSRGDFTVECIVLLEDGSCGIASSPSGASVGEHEAIEVEFSQAIKNIEGEISSALVGKSADFLLCDKLDLQLGANAVLATQIALLRAQARSKKVEPYQLIAKICGTKETLLPTPMFNVINGGVHAANSLDFQEFMIMPARFNSFFESVSAVALIYKNLKKLLEQENFVTGVGDEGGFAPNFSGSSPERVALDFLMRAVELSGFHPGDDILFCLDVAASQFFSKKESTYLLNKKTLSSSELIELYGDLVSSYPIFSIEDPLDENDWDGWGELTSALGDKVMLVGDDIFVTNPERIKIGVEKKVANAVLIKPNQIGSLGKCLEAIRLSKESGYKTVVSHRSGETNDSFIADLAVGAGAAFIKAGAPARGERVAKYNRLLGILPRNLARR